MLVVGFTGTREGMTPPQKATVTAFMTKLSTQPSKGVHGDCLGADFDFHRILRSLGVEAYSRPCTLSHQRAYTDAVLLASPDSPLVRNQRIVEDCDVLLVCPKTFREELRSGTWATYRRACRARKRVIVFYPDGSVNKGIVTGCGNA